MTTTEKGRTRPRLIKLGAGLTLAGVTLGVVGTGVADAQGVPVSAPLNVTVTQVAGPALNINWDAPTTGGPPTFYRVIADITTTPQIDFVTQVPATQTEFNGLQAAANTTYAVTVESNNENSFAASTVTITTAATSVECSTAVWAPFCTVEAFIRQQYRDWENRAPTLDELNFWRAYLQADSTTGRNQAPGASQDQFLDNLRRHKDIVAGPTTRLYISYFLRNPEFAGYTFWLNAVESGAWSMPAVSDYFARSPEFISRYGALDNAEFVSLVYQNVLGRNPDATGFSFWTRQLQAGQTRGWMMLQFTEAPSQEFQSKTRIAVAATEVWAEMLNRVPNLAEYDQATMSMLGAPYPLTPASVNPLYTGVLARAEYRSAARNGGPIVIR